MEEIRSVQLSIEQIKELIGMLEGSNFKGSSWRKIGELIENLEEGLISESVDNNDKDSS